MRPRRLQVARSKRLLLPAFERLLRAQLISSARQSRSLTVCPLIKSVIFQRYPWVMRLRQLQVRHLTRKTAVPQSSQSVVWAHFWEPRSLMVVKQLTAAETAQSTSVFFHQKCLTRLRFISPNQRNILRVL